MIKINSIKVKKLWGYEIWLHSPYINNQTSDEKGNKCIEGPLVKIIKANKPLSVQVHPDDKLAKELEGQSNGKAECWYVLESDKNSNYIVGIKTLDKDLIRSKLQDKTFEDILKVIKVKPRDFINVPAGMVHGIGPNSKVMEVQQPSDTTYRFFDYNRLEKGKPRELHIEKSLKSIKDVDYKLKSSKKKNDKYDIGFYQISIFDKSNKNNLSITKRSIIVDLKNEQAYYVMPGEKVNIDWLALIEY